VDALVEATARILVKAGFDHASTNRIAGEAGVSIGSLYQYFPSKEALVGAVMDRHQRELMQVVRGVLPQVAGLPMQQALRKLITLGITAHQIDPKLHRVLAEQIPRTGRLKDIEAFDRENYSLFRTWLEGRRDEIRAVDLDMAAFVCVTAIEAVTHRAVLHHSETFSENALESLIDEATRLVVRYLNP